MAFKVYVQGIKFQHQSRRQWVWHCSRLNSRWLCLFASGPLWYPGAHSELPACQNVLLSYIQLSLQYRFPSSPKNSSSSFHQLSPNFCSFFISSPRLNQPQWLTNTPSSSLDSNWNHLYKATSQQVLYKWNSVLLPLQHPPPSPSPPLPSSEQITSNFSYSQLLFLHYIHRFLSCLSRRPLPRSCNFLYHGSFALSFWDRSGRVLVVWLLLCYFPLFLLFYQLLFRSHNYKL